MTCSAQISKIDVAAFTVPTDAPESDGTYAWDKTTIVVAFAAAAGQQGLGYTYANKATALLIKEHLAEQLIGRDALDINGAWLAMVKSIRNLGRPGICSMAIAAVDTAVWDLKARILGVSLSKLIGQVRDAVPLYGSGGFTSYDHEQLAAQLGGWAANGFNRVKMKVGREPDRDLERVRNARAAIGNDCELFVDANGAYTRKQAACFADQFREFAVSWFEEPVSSDDLEGLHLLRDRSPSGMAIAAGEYGYDSTYFRRMLEAQAVDVLQADATRCAGITGLLQVAALCGARSMPLSAHTAPNVHAHPATAIEHLVHLEYFHDHARIEQMLFDGALKPKQGRLCPDISQPGMGLTLKAQDAAQYAI